MKEEEEVKKEEEEVVEEEEEVVEEEEVEVVVVGIIDVPHEVFALVIDLFLGIFPWW